MVFLILLIWETERIDIAVLIAFLTPFLPFLVSAGQKASEKAGEKFGEDAWAKAKAIWIKLHLKVEAKEDVKVAIEQVAAKPDSNARKAVLQSPQDSGYVTFSGSCSPCSTFANSIRCYSNLFTAHSPRLQLLLLD